MTRVTTQAAHTIWTFAGWHKRIGYGPACEARRLLSMSSSLSGCSLGRVVEEELITVGIIDY